MSEKVTVLSEGVQGLFINNTRFNTTLISFNFYLPLKEETAAAMGLLPFILTTCSRKYSDFSQLNYKLAKLYGAKLEASTEKAGDLQLLKVGISVIDDNYTLDNESLCIEACEMLFNLIFDPKVENGAFCEEDVEREKRKAIEHIRGEMSEKRIYAKNRLISEMYKGKAYGVSKCGTQEQVAALDGAELYNAWKKMISSAFVRVNVISRSMPSGLFSSISERFSLVERFDITDYTVCEPTEAAQEVNHVVERMDVAQGKLVMGFSSELYGDDTKAMPLLIMCDIFGGGPYSRLFTNVREKLSLCYYCSASSIRTKGLLTVDSGVEAPNAERAFTEILAQLEIMKQGKFSEFEFESSKKSVTDSFKTYDDSQSALDVWYSLRIGSDRPLSPTEAAQYVGSVTVDDVIKAANGVKLHTVYKLLPEEKA